MLTVEQLYSVLSDKMKGLPEVLVNETPADYVSRIVKENPSLSRLFLLKEALNCASQLTECSKQGQTQEQLEKSEAAFSEYVAKIQGKIKDVVILQDQQGNFHAKLSPDAFMPSHLLETEPVLAGELRRFSHDIYYGFTDESQSKIYGLVDPVYTQFMVQAYGEAVRDIQDASLREKIRTSLLTSMHWMSPNLEDFERMLRTRLKMQTVSEVEIDLLIKKIIPSLEKDFSHLQEQDDQLVSISALSVQPKFNDASKTPSSEPGVAILTCNSGNAHRIIAQTVSSRLSDSGVCAAVINESDLYQDDVLKQFTGISYGVLYPVIVQQLALPAVRNQLKDINRELLTYTVSLNSVKLRQAMRQVEDKFHIGSVYVTTHQTSALNCVPKDAVAQVQLCDFGPILSLTPEIADLAMEAGVIDAKRIKLLSPNSKEAMDQDIEKLMSTEARTMPSQKPEHLDKVVLLSTYPVCELSSEQAKQKYELFCHDNGYTHSPDRIKCVLCVGGQGCAEAIHKYVECVRAELEKQAFSKPIDLFVVCGRNDALKNDLMTKYQRLSDSDLPLRVMPLGYMENTQYLSLAQQSVLISKPGGATVAECSLNGISALLLVDKQKFPWEGLNADHLEQAGLGQQYDATVSIIDQIDALDTKREERVNIETPTEKRIKSPDVGKLVKDALIDLKAKRRRGSESGSEQGMSPVSDVEQEVSPSPKK